MNFLGVILVFLQQCYRRCHRDLNCITTNLAHDINGKPEWLERARPVMDAYANQIIPLGEEPAVAMSMKLAGNFMVASLIELIGESYVFAESRSVDTAILTGMFKQFIPAASEHVAGQT